MATNISAILPLLPQALQEQFPKYEENMQPNMYAAIAISLFLACACVGLRVYGRRLQAQKLWWDDYTSIIALFFTLISTAALLSLVILGFGRHQIVLVLEHPNNILALLRMLIVSDALYFPSICFSKMSILFQYRRLFPAQRFKWVLLAVGAASTVYCIVGMIVITVLCLPIKGPSLDNPMEHPLACHNIRDMIFWICSWNAVLDFIILFLPMPYVWRLQTTFRRKIQLTGLFFIGSFVVVISVLRTWYFTHLIPADFTWTAATGNMWTEVEGCMAIVAGCLPAMMPIFRNIFGRKKSTNKPADNMNLVTFGSGGKKIKLNDISIMETTVTATTHHDGNYTELVDQPVQGTQNQYYQGTMNQFGGQPQHQYYPGGMAQYEGQGPDQYYVYPGNTISQFEQENQARYYQGGNRW